METPSAISKASLAGVAVVCELAEEDSVLVQLQALPQRAQFQLLVRRTREQCEM